MKLNEFADLTSSEFVSKYTEYYVQHCVEVVVNTWEFMKYFDEPLESGEIWLVFCCCKLELELNCL